MPIAADPRPKTSVATVAAAMQKVFPLRPELSVSIAAKIVTFAAAQDRDPWSLTLCELTEAAAAAQTRTPDGWYAVGKLDGSWHAVAPSTPAEPFPVDVVVRGRRRRLLEPQDLAGARAFASAALARAAGRTVFPRTYVVGIRGGAVVSGRAAANTAQRRSLSPDGLDSLFTADE